MFNRMGLESDSPNYVSSKRSVLCFLILVYRSGNPFVHAHFYMISTSVSREFQKDFNGTIINKKNGPGIEIYSKKKLHIYQLFGSIQQT